MKQVPKVAVYILFVVYLITLAIQMNTAVQYMGKATATSSVNVVGPNNPPYLNITYPNLTWYRFSSYIGPSLDDHFVDPDGDPLNYTSIGNSNILIQFDPDTGEPTFTPSGEWWGIEYIWFNATDPGGLSNISNLVMLNVTYRPIPEQPTGGGGGGRESPECVEKWICTNWGDCIDGRQTRSCRELNKCGTERARPLLEQECHISTCHDLIANCHDGSCEEDVDCGGPCSPCGTCYDKLKNCHDGKCESGVDCGGPCLPCQLVEIREVAFEKAPWFLLALVLVAVFFIEAYIYYIKHYKEYRRYKNVPQRPRYKPRTKEAKRSE